ncbi:MAG TPA: site-2 protease family protein [Planctomycetes bacterium]|nr:site-2 protease family protein [Planctomycetota bacterium]
MNETEFSARLEFLPWILGMLIITSCVHEAGHAWTAWRMGDQRPYIRTRSNPASWRHISLIFTIILPSALMLMGAPLLGGAKPVMVRTAIGPRRMALVALAGPMGNILVGVLSIGVLAGLLHARILTPSWQWDRYYVFALYAVALNFILALLNLLPLPPFDGSRIVAMFLPEKIRNIYYRLTIPVLIVFVVLILFSDRLFDDALGRFTLGVLHIVHDAVLSVQHWIEL